jgi:choline kinase
MNFPRVLILAAGSAQRLRPLTDQIPKTLLRLGDRTILHHIVGCCAACGLSQITIVTGHGEAAVRSEGERIGAAMPSSDVSYIHCRHYARMGNVYSLYEARTLFQAPLVLINSDLVFAHEILKNLLACSADNALVIDDHKELGIEEMKVNIEEGAVTKINKQLDPASSAGEYIGMTKLSSSIAASLEEALHRLVETAPESYYEDAFQLLMNQGISFEGVSTGGAACMEIDTFDDLAAARAKTHLWV